MILLFWISIVIIFYTYFGYGLIIWILVKLKSGNNQSSNNLLPSITVVIPCYNEASVIEEKIKNTLTLKYEFSKIKYICITDGSTDETNEIVKKYPQIELLYEPIRAGKSAAENRSMKFVQTDLVVFCDANAILNEDALLYIAKCFDDEKVGGVSGEKRFMLEEGDGVEGSEGIYWKYESFLKKLDSKFYTVVGAAGELFAIRRSLYETLPEDTINDDLTQSLMVNLKGYAIRYSAEAYATERPSENVAEEKKRKIRMIAGAWQSMTRLPQALNPFHDFKLFFQFFSHRVLRWTLCPLALPVSVLTNLYIYIQEPNLFIYQLSLMSFLIFYGFAGLGYILRHSSINIKVFNFSYYFVFMNYCAYLGFFRFINGNQKSTWERSQRKI